MLHVDAACCAGRVAALVGLLRERVEEMVRLLLRKARGRRLHSRIATLTKSDSGAEFTHSGDDSIMPEMLVLHCLSEHLDRARLPARERQRQHVKQHKKSQAREYRL